MSRCAYRRDPVGDATDARSRRVVLVGDPTARAWVAVAAGLGEGLTAEEQLRAGHQPFPLGVVDPVVGAAYVTHGREAAAQHPVEDAGRPEGHVGGRQLGQEREIGGHRRDVHMAVDEPREDEPPRGVERRHPRARSQASSDVDDPAVEDPNVPVTPLAGHDIEVPAATDEKTATLLAAIVVHGVRSYQVRPGLGSPDRPWADPSSRRGVRPCGAPARPPMRAGAPSASPDVTRTHAPSREIRDISKALPIG